MNRTEQAMAQVTGAKKVTMVKNQNGFVYRTETDWDAMMTSNGTSFQGEMFAKYHRLVELFGKPHEHFDDYKCDAAWHVEFDDGVIATIYNWKNGRNYCGFDAPHVEDIVEWNIGGFNLEAARRIQQLCKPEPLDQNIHVTVSLRLKNGADAERVLSDMNYEFSDADIEDFRIIDHEVIDVLRLER